MASLTCTPAAPTAVTDFCRVDILDAPENTLTGYNASQYPSSPEVRYYVTFTEGGVEYGRTPVFSTSSEGKWQFNNYLFPHAGSWTLTLADESDDSTVATLAVTVS
jgi:hypothetical protein